MGLIQIGKLHLCEAFPFNDSSAFTCVDLIKQWDFVFENVAQFLSKMGRDGV